MEWFKNLGGAAMIAALLAVSGPAEAVLVTSGSPTFSVFDTANNGALAGELTFSNFSFTSTSGGVTFSTQIMVQNIGSGPTSDRLTAFGFNTTPDATGGSDTSSVFNTFLNQTFPSFQTVDVCGSSGPDCAGGSNGGLSPGQTDTFILSLTGLPTGTSSIDLGTNTLGGTETFDFKYQTANGSFETSGTPGTCPPGVPGCVVNPPTTVPEPASLVLLGSGLIGLGGMKKVAAWRRRRREFKASKLS